MEQYQLDLFGCACEKSHFKFVGIYLKMKNRESRNTCKKYIFYLVPSQRYQDFRHILQHPKLP